MIDSGYGQQLADELEKHQRMVADYEQEPKAGVLFRRPERASEQESKPQR